MKGKYAQRAARTRDLNGLGQRAESAERVSNRLAQELAEVKQDRDAQVAALRAALRSVTAERDAASSPRVAELESLAKELRQRADDAESARKKIQHTQGRLTEFVTKLLRDLTGCTGLEALEAVIKRLGPSFEVLIGQAAGADVPKGSDPGEAVALQKTRGYRSSAKVIEHLNALCDAATKRSRTAHERNLDRWRDT